MSIIPDSAMGFDAVDAAMEKAKNSGGSGDFMPFLTWKDDRDGEKKEYLKVVRFLPYTIITCKTYDFVPCDDGKTRSFISGPSLGLTDPEYRDFIAENNIQIPDYNKKMQPPKAKDATIGMAVVREEVVEKINGVATRVVRDKIVERKWVDKDGNEHVEKGPQLVIVKQAHKNFWSMFSAYNNRYKNIWDRDYIVERRRNDKDTTYAVMAADPDDELRTEEALLERYKPPFTLEEWVLNMAKNSRMEEYLKGRASGAVNVETTPLADNGTDGEEAPDEAQVRSSENSRFSSLRDNLAQSK